MYENLLTDLTIPKQCFAHRQQITSNIAAIMFLYVKGLTKLQSTLMIAPKITFS